MEYKWDLPSAGQFYRKKKKKFISSSFLLFKPFPSSNFFLSGSEDSKKSSAQARIELDAHLWSSAPRVPLPLLVYTGKEHLVDTRQPQLLS